MDPQKKLLGLLLVLLGLLSLSQGIRIKEGIYTDLKEKAFCFRRTNGTNQLGCTSAPGGNVGIVHLISSDSDTSWLIEKGTHDPYVALITPKFFKKDTLHLLKQSGKVSIVVVIFTIIILANFTNYLMLLAC